MALFVNQNENQTDLQKRIAADLREKAIKNSAGEGERILVAVRLIW